MIFGRLFKDWQKGHELALDLRIGAELADLSKIGIRIGIRIGIGLVDC